MRQERVDFVWSCGVFGLHRKRAWCKKSAIKRYAQWATAFVRTHSGWHFYESWLDIPEGDAWRFLRKGEGV